jgi:hypothetical protein
VVDCQQADAQPMGQFGLAADVNRAEFGYRQAIIILWDGQ